MSSSLRQKTNQYTSLQWWLLAGLGIFCIGFYLLVYRPADVRSAQLAEGVERQRRELSAARARARDLPRIAAENEDLSMRLARSKRLPKLAEWSEFVRDITRLSNQTSLKKFTYKYGLAKRDDTFSQLPIVLDFEGDMLDVYAFLRQSEELPRLTRLRSIAMKSRPEKPGNVHVELSLNTYFSTEP